MKQNYKICRGKKNHSRWLSTQHLDKSSTHYQLTIVTFIFTSTKYIKETLIYIFLIKYFNQQKKNSNGNLTSKYYDNVITSIFLS